MSCPFDIATYIASTLAMGTLGTNVFVNSMPNSPDSAVTVYEYSGWPTTIGMGNPDTDVLENLSLQVATRHPESSTAHARAQTIYRGLDGRGDLTINGVTYLWLRAAQAPFLLKRDENQRETFVFNLAVQRRRG